MLIKTKDTVAHQENGVPVEVPIYEKDFVVTRRIDVVSLRKRKAELQKELKEIDSAIIEIVSSEAGTL